MENIPRRIQVEKLSFAETVIRNAILFVEEMGADPSLTDAVVLLSQAKDKVADFVDRGLADRTFHDTGNRSFNIVQEVIPIESELFDNLEKLAEIRHPNDPFLKLDKDKNTISAMCVFTKNI